MNSSTIKSLKLRMSGALPEQKLTALYQSALQHIGRVAACPIIHIASARRNEGAARIAFETAMLVSQKMDKKVLFIEGSVDIPEILKGLTIKHETGVNVAEKKSEPAIYETDTENLSICWLYDSSGSAPSPDNVKTFLETARLSHEVIILHTENMLLNESTFVISQFTDATLMVIEAERTRSPVALQLKHILEQNGANIAGCILNRRRFHIPGWIYKFLFKT